MLILKQKYFLTLLAPLFLISCKVMLIGAYDEVTDQGIQKVQSEISTILIRLERNIDNNTVAENDYKNFKEKYEAIAGQLETLRVRCNSIPKYNIILGQIAALTANVSDFEKLHKTGISNKQMLAVIKSNFEMQFSSMIKLQNGLKRKKLN